VCPWQAGEISRRALPDIGPIRLPEQCPKQIYAATEQRRRPHVCLREQATREPAVSCNRKQSVEDGGDGGQRLNFVLFGTSD